MSDATSWTSLVHIAIGPFEITDLMKEGHGQIGEGFLVRIIVCQFAGQDFPVLPSLDGIYKRDVINLVKTGTLENQVNQ